MRFGQIILAYFVIGAVMFGGGAISFQDAGVTKFFVDDAGDTFETSDNASGTLDRLGNAITNLINAALGAIQLIYNLVVGLLGYLNWPILVLSTNNAPPIAVLLLGGSFQVAFYVSVVRLVRVSA